VRGENANLYWSEVTRWLLLLPLQQPSTFDAGNGLLGSFLQLGFMSLRHVVDLDNRPSRRVHNTGVIVDGLTDKGRNQSHVLEIIYTMTVNSWVDGQIHTSNVIQSAGSRPLK
jgi:hypothetical protein